MKKRSFLLISWGNHFTLLAAAVLLVCGLVPGQVSALRPEPGTVIDKDNMEQYKEVIHPVMQAWIAEDGWTMKVGPKQEE